MRKDNPMVQVEDKHIHESIRCKILILVKGLGLGGAERLLVDSIPYLNREQFDYHLAYFLPWKDFLVPQFEQAGVPVYCLGTMRGNPGLANGRAPRADYRRGTGNSALAWGLWRLDRLLQQERFDLIQADLPVAGIIARFLGRRHRVPVIYTEHNVQERYHPLTRWANRFTYGWNTYALAVSQEVSESIQRARMHRRTRVETLLNGVPVEQIRLEAGDTDRLRQEFNIPKNHWVVGAVAVFRRQKRLEDWLEVAEQVAARRADVTFLLVGDGPEMARVRATVQSLGLADRIRLPGFRTDGRRCIGLMDLYLMTSEFEGLPIALLEAMTLAIPVVSTHAGGIPELVQQGREGLLTAVGDTAAMANHVVQLLETPERRLAMGQAGAEKVETQFHLKNRVQHIEALYRQVLQKAAV